MTTTIIDRLMAAASATYTDEAQAAIRAAVLELSRLQTEAATYQAMYECAFGILTCQKFLKNQEATDGPHEQD